MTWSYSFLEEILRQLKSSNRICLEFCGTAKRQHPQITFKARHYKSDIVDRPNCYNYMIIISNDERRRLYREYKADYTDPLLKS